MAEMEIHSLEDGPNLCGKCKSKKCGCNKGKGGTPEAENVNIINIGNDVFANNKSNTDNTDNHSRTGGMMGGGGTNTHTKEVVIQEKEIPVVIEKLVHDESQDTALVMAVTAARNVPLPYRLFAGSTRRNGNYSVIHRAFY
jgi:hypothetical protein